MEDVTKVNRFIGIVTTANAFIDINSVVYYLPCVFYHLHHKDVCLFSTKTYPQIHRGHSLVHGFQVGMIFPDHKILISIEKQKGNHPRVHNSQFTPKENNLYGSQIRSALAYSVLENLVIFGDICPTNILYHDTTGTKGGIAGDFDIFKISVVLVLAQMKMKICLVQK